jgi:hypothetical protein
MYFDLKFMMAAPAFEMLSFIGSWRNHPMAMIRIQAVETTDCVRFTVCYQSNSN